MSERASHAVILSTDPGAKERLADLVDTLDGLGVSVEHTDSVANATTAVLTHPGGPACVVVDSRGQFAAIVGALRDGIPFATPLVVFRDPPVEIAIAAFRSGAGDVLDLSEATEEVVERSVLRVSEKYRARSRRTEQLTELRDALDEFLRAVVQTERRSIDLENQLAAQKAGSLRSTADDTERRPVVLIVVPDRELSNLLVDRLEDMGVITFAFVTGEEAVTHAKQAAADSEPIDLAVIDAEVPGMTGALADLREDRPYLSAIVLGDRPGAEAAVEAAELGVVGYVPQPIQDVAHVLERVREQAIDNQQSGRERHYLSRIKGRHERVLTRYRELKTSLDEWEL